MKRNNQIRSTGIDPEVMKSSESNVQKFMNQLLRILTAYACIIFIVHATGYQFASMFSRFEPLNNLSFDIGGFLIGIWGLSLCAYAQIKMGKSWRVGIDEKVKTNLITSGLYKFIRNPTYLGLFILNIGVWVIWPTWTIFLLNLMFVIILEIQVRCEEDFLTKVHGQQYMEYKSRTKRYIPFIY
ncbi:hypothetical protein DCMF_10135 [Candidatus Formimonas warabiya]|uniref:Isoprenylcysteine carboxylmethyltransferase family protein n=2 Tax=Formimonas warabiya TaxID=1761012 RepID=A0A3G1L156_FORW1|nr:hypothetical protein DCMF_10135 [Candidatus Formimonas warabiya]